MTRIVIHAEFDGFGFLQVRKVAIRGDFFQ